MADSSPCARTVDPRHVKGLEKLTCVRLAEVISQKNTISSEVITEALYAQDKHRVIVVMQAMDTGGKDGCIKHVFSRVDPQGLNVVSFSFFSGPQVSSTSACQSIIFSTAIQDRAMDFLFEVSTICEKNFWEF